MDSSAKMEARATTASGRMGVVRQRRLAEETAARQKAEAEKQKAEAEKQKERAARQKAEAALEHESQARLQALAEVEGLKAQLRQIQEGSDG